MKLIFTGDAVCATMSAEGMRMEKLFTARDIHIYSVFMAGSEAPEGERRQFGSSLSHCELIYILNAETDVTFQGVTLREKTGCVRYLPKGRRTTPYYVDYIHNGHCIDIYIDSDSPLPERFFVADFADNATLPRLFTRALQVWQRREVGWYNECQYILYALLAEMERAAEARAPLAHRTKIEKAMEYLHENYLSDSFDFAQLARLSGVSYTYFKRLFAEIYGTTPSAYVKSLRLSRACELLGTGRFTVTQVAEMCGYGSVYYFCRVFRAEMGVSPGQFSTARCGG